MSNENMCMRNKIAIIRTALLGCAVFGYLGVARLLSQGARHPSALYTLCHEMCNRI